MKRDILGQTEQELCETAVDRTVNWRGFAYVGTERDILTGTAGTERDANASAGRDRRGHPPLGGVPVSRPASRVPFTGGERFARSGKRWTDAEREALTRMWADDSLTRRDVARVSRRTLQAIAVEASKLGLGDKAGWVRK